MWKHAPPWENEDSSWIADVDLPDLETVNSEPKDEENDNMSDIQTGDVDWTTQVSLKFLKNLIKCIWMLWQDNQN